MALLAHPSFYAGSHGSVDRLRREMDGLFERFGAESARPLRSGVYPALNVYETAAGYVLTAELPGVRSEDLELHIEGHAVTLRGERGAEAPDEEGASVHRRECQAGVFRRTLELPVELDAEKAEATLRNGVLMLRIPKAPRHQPRHIPVRTGS